MWSFDYQAIFIVYALTLMITNIPVVVCEKEPRPPFNLVLKNLTMSAHLYLWGKYTSHCMYKGTMSPLIFVLKNLIMSAHL